MASCILELLGHFLNIMSQIFSETRYVNLALLFDNLSDRYVIDFTQLKLIVSILRLDVNESWHSSQIQVLFWLLCFDQQKTVIHEIVLSQELRISDNDLKKPLLLTLMNFEFIVVF